MLNDKRLAFDTCGHGVSPRRVCDVCKTTSYVFAACSHECLRAHQQLSHDPQLPADTATRARWAQVNRNRLSPDVWERFASHRERLMTLIPPQPAGGALCVLGAGKCDDLDLPRLARQFSRVHLVDIDEEALERARARQPPSVRDALVLHGGVDLSGLLEHLDDWGDAFPDDHSLPEAVYRATRAVTAALGGPFAVALSTCVLSQLVVPFRTAWAAPESTWRKLNAALTAIHVGVLARVTARGGAVRLVFDVLSSAEAPRLLELRNSSPAELRAAVDAGARKGDVLLQPDPTQLLSQIRSLELSAPGVGLILTEPWLWDTGTALHLVYALAFQRN